VYPPGEEVAVNDVAADPDPDAVNVIVADPLLYGLLVPTFVAVPIVGALGVKKLSCAEDLIPLFLLVAILLLLYYYIKLMLC